MRVVVELEKLMTRPCGKRSLGADEPAGELALRHRLHDGAVAREVVSVHAVKQHHKVDVAAFARLAPRAASLKPNEAQAIPELRLQLFFRLFCPCERVHRGSFPCLPDGRLYRPAGMTEAQANEKRGRPFSRCC